MFGYRIGISVHKGFLATIGNKIGKFFARYFNTSTNYGTVDSLEVILDTANDQTRTAGLTTVVDTDFTAEVWIDSASQIAGLDSATIIENSNVEVAVTYAYQTGQTVNSVAGRSGYRVILPVSKNVSSLKFLDASSNILHEYLLNEGAGTNEDNIIVLDRINGKHGELVNATLPSAWAGVFDRSDPSNTDGYSVSNNTEYGSNLVDNSSDWIDTNEDGLADGWLISSLVTPSIVTGNGFTGNAQRVEDNTGLSARFIYSNFTPIVGRRYKINLKYRSNKPSFRITGGATHVFGANTGNAVNGSIVLLCTSATVFRFTFSDGDLGDWVEIDDVSIQKVLPDGIKIPASTSTIDIFGNALTFSGQAGYHAKTYAQALKGDGVAYLAFANLPAYDAITVIEDGTQVSISLTAGEWTPTSGKYYRNISFKLSGVEVALFIISQFKPNSSPASVIFDDSYETGATATLTNHTLGAGGNLSQMEGLADINLNGFNPAVISDGVDDRINTGILSSNSIEVDFWGRFLKLEDADLIGCFVSGEDSRCYFGTQSGGWRFGFASEAGVTSPSGTADKNLHKFSIRNRKFYVDDVEIIDRSGLSIESSTALFYFFSIAAAAGNNTSFELIKATINGITFLPQTDGTIKDSNGVTYTNQGTGSLGVKYIPSSAINAGKDIAGLDLRYSAGTSKLLKASWKQNYELIQKDADNVLFDVSGNPIEVNMDTLTDNDYVDVTRDNDGNITDLKINK